MAKQITPERATRLVKQYLGQGTVEQTNAVVARMVTYGECVWHAASQVTGKPCNCHDCKP